MRRILSIFLVLSFMPVTVSLAAEADSAGLISKKSKYSATKTINRLQSILKKKGITIFARVSHTKGAKKVKLKLRPTELLIFGNPKLGTPVMQSNQKMGIDLPMKALAWKDAKGQVWLTYNDPAYMAKRHGITDKDDIVKKQTNALNKFTDMAIK